MPRRASSASWRSSPSSPARRTTPTTPPSSDTFQLPDCAEYVDDVVSDDLLDAVDSAALVRALAEEGIEGARRLLRQQASEDSALRERLERLRDRLRRQGRRRVERVVEEYDQQVVALDEVRHRTDAEVARQIAELEARLREARSIDWSRLPPADLLADVTNALLLPTASWNQPPKPPGLLARLRAAFARLVAWLRRLFSRGRRAPEPSSKGRRMAFATAAADGRVLGPSDLGNALAQLSGPEREELENHVAGGIRSREREIEKEAEEKRRQAEAQRRRLEQERAEAQRRAEADAESRVRQAEERRVERELKERGFVADRQGELVVTYGLVERFARLLLEEESQRLPGEFRMSMRGGGSTGVYEKARLRRPEEIAHLDVPGSLLAARFTGSKHIDESTSYVFREVTSERVHIVLAFDRSGSMSEEGKLEAAKKALLALYVAIRKRHPDATIDVLAFDNDVQVLDLVELWECRAGAFTNTAEALRAAHLLLRASRATRREVYLITDGLPEAYTDDEGRVHSGQLDAAMEHALARAGELATVASLKSTVLLLKSEHPEYEPAARAIARTLHGEMVVTDPGHLGVELLVRWAHGEETERRLTTTAPVATPPPAAPGRPRGRRKKADRRMGG